MALMIGCILHGLDALQGTGAKLGNHLVIYKATCIETPPSPVLQLPIVDQWYALDLLKVAQHTNQSIEPHTKVDI